MKPEKRQGDFDGQRIVLVEFYDAWSCSATDEETCIEIVVGFIHRQDKRYLILTQAYYWDQGVAEKKGFFGIPLGCIKKITPLTAHGGGVKKKNNTKDPFRCICPADLQPKKGGPVHITPRDCLTTKEEIAAARKRNKG